MLNENSNISECKVKLQKKHRSQEIDIILELLIDVDDSYFFGVDELREILASQASKKHQSFF